MPREVYDSYAPVFSFYIDPKKFADLPMPLCEDWEAATGLVFPPSLITDKQAQKKKSASGEKQKNFKSPRDLFLPENMKAFDCKWEDKVPTAFFRGTATGGGVSRWRATRGFTWRRSLMNGRYLEPYSLSNEAVEMADHQCLHLFPIPNLYSSLSLCLSLSMYMYTHTQTESMNLLLSSLCV